MVLLKPQQFDEVSNRIPPTSQQHQTLFLLMSEHVNSFASDSAALQGSELVCGAYPGAFSSTRLRLQMSAMTGFYHVR